MRLVVGIDACRNRSGGAKAHLIGILSELVPERYGIDEVHIWSFGALLDAIPDRPWLVKHQSPMLEHSLGSQLIWQAVRCAAEMKAAGCHVAFASDASSLCTFKPIVVLSQDMLSYEPGVMESYGWGYARLRLWAILYLQNAAFRRAQGVIFLTRYAGRAIQQSCGSLYRVAYVPHGVGDAFKHVRPLREFQGHGVRPLRCIYVSPISRYKHQWVVVRAIELLRRQGYSVTLDLIGSDDGTGKGLLDKQLAMSDPGGEFVRRLGAVTQAELPRLLSEADLFIFASACENMPVTLLEAMAVGLPIACSDRGPMPEVLEDGGVYFNPEDAESIAGAVARIIDKPALRVAIAARAKALAKQYSWARCADETFTFIGETCQLTSPIGS